MTSPTVVGYNQTGALAVVPENSLLCRIAESPKNEAINGCLHRFTSKIERANETKRVSGLFQAVHGQAAELP